MNHELRTALLVLAAGISVVAQSPPTYVIRTVVGNGALQPVAAKDIDVVPGLEANLTEPHYVVLDSGGRVYFSDRNMVRRYDPATGLVTRIAGQFAEIGSGGSFAGDFGPAPQSKLRLVTGLVFDKDSRLLVADAGNGRIRKISNLRTAEPLIETFAGNGVLQDRGDNGPMANASFQTPTELAYSKDGTLYIGSVLTNRLRTIEPNGMLGPGWGPANNVCTFDIPICKVSALATDQAGNVLAADFATQIYAIQPDRRFVLIAGKERISSGFGGDGGPATAASFGSIYGIAPDQQGNILVSDTGSQRIRRIAQDGTIQSIAGTGRAGTLANLGALVGEGGLALEADLWLPRGVALDPQGKAYFADSGNRRIRVLIPCSSELRSANATFDSLGGDSEVEIVSNESACKWTVTSESTWLSLTSSGNGTGSGKLGIRLSPNSGNTPRTANLRLGSRVLTITQLPSGAVFPRIASVANGASFATGLAAGAWFVVTGTNLAQSTRSWGDSDFAGEKLPTSLDGISVKVGGRDAYPYFISPTQLNVLAPSVAASGPVTVEVTNRFGRSVFAATAKSVDPAFFVIGIADDGKSLAAAVHPDGTLVGEIGSLPGAAMRPAKPGAPIIVFGTGFGPANPPVREGVIGFPPAPLALSGHLKSGQWRSPQNRPMER